MANVCYVYANLSKYSKIRPSSFTHRSPGLNTLPVTVTICTKLINIIVSVLLTTIASKIVDILQGYVIQN